MSLHGKIIEYLDVLASYLPLFERWTNLFHPSDYTELVACIKITCAEFFNYMVDSILFFRKSAFCKLSRTSRSVSSANKLRSEFF
jgi:hypothetical protein